MEEEFDSKKVPARFVYCANENCPVGAVCLRRLAYTHVSKELATIHCVNLAALPADSATCPHFLPAIKVKMAWGTSRLLEGLPYEKALAINRDYPAPRETHHAPKTAANRRDLPVLWHPYVAPIRPYNRGIRLQVVPFAPSRHRHVSQKVVGVGFSPALVQARPRRGPTETHGRSKGDPGVV